MAAYYNEIDPYAAQALRNYIKAGLIAPGEVDERSIIEVTPDDIKNFTQCHFFAGIGIWSYALRAAGWDDNRPIWTGSCPCQPFSIVGTGTGLSDDRHLWPAWFELIKQRPTVPILGEQVSDGGGLTWFDVVQNDLAGEGYTVGSLSINSASVGAPTIRQRLYWLGNPEYKGLEGHAGAEIDQKRRQEPNRPGPAPGVGDVQPGRTNGYWASADWRDGADGKTRPVRRGSFPMVTGDTNRVGRIRAYGNAINAEVAKHFIAAAMDCM